MKELFWALPRLLDEFEDNADVREAVAFAAWRKIAGSSLCEHTVPFRLFGKHLIIAVADRMWKRHLEELSGQMIHKLNSALRREIVTFVEFRIDHQTVAKARAKLPRRAGTTEEQKQAALNKVTPKIRRSADAIKDDGLRYQFLLAAGSCLARSERMRERKS